MATRIPTDPELLAAAARLAGVQFAPDRYAQLVPAMNGFYQLLDKLHRGELGETPPAIGFRAYGSEN